MRTHLCILLFCNIVQLVFWESCVLGGFSLCLCFPPFFLSFYLCISPSVTNSLLLYFSRSSCPFLTRSTPSACLSLSLCLWPCFCRHLFWFFLFFFFSLSLSFSLSPSFIFSYAKAKTRQKPIQQETPPRSRPQRLRNKQGRATP